MKRSSGFNDVRDMSPASGKSTVRWRGWSGNPMRYHMMCVIPHKLRWVYSELFLATSAGGGGVGGSRTRIPLLTSLRSSRSFSNLPSMSRSFPAITGPSVVFCILCTWEPQQKNLAWWVLLGMVGLPLAQHRGSITQRNEESCGHGMSFSPHGGVVPSVVGAFLGVTGVAH